MHWAENQVVDAVVEHYTGCNDHVTVQHGFSACLLRVCLTHVTFQSGLTDVHRVERAAVL